MDLIVEIMAQLGQTQVSLGNLPGFTAWSKSHHSLIVGTNHT